VLGYIKPSVPEFIVKWASKPYYVPANYKIDPYTGANVTVSDGYWVKNESIIFTIKNQQFTPYTDAEGNYVSLTYYIQTKGHFEPEWTNLGHFDATDAEYLVKGYAFGDNAYLAIFGNVPSGGKLDFQLEARVGYYTVNMAQCKEYFTGEASGWSNIVTLTVGESQTPSPGTTPTPEGGFQQIEPVGLLFLLIAAFVFGAGLATVVYLVKK
jgi:hypothetical protein